MLKRVSKGGGWRLLKGRLELVGKKVVEGAEEKDLVDVLPLARLSVLPIGEDPYGKVIDDGRQPWLSSSGRIDRDPTKCHA